MVLLAFPWKLHVLSWLCKWFYCRSNRFPGPSIGIILKLLGPFSLPNFSPNSSPQASISLWGFHQIPPQASIFLPNSCPKLPFFLKIGTEFITEILTKLFAPFSMTALNSSAHTSTSSSQRSACLTVTLVPYFCWVWPHNRLCPSHTPPDRTYGHHHHWNDSWCIHP